MLGNKRLTSVHGGIIALALVAFDPQAKLAKCKATRAQALYTQIKAGNKRSGGGGGTGPARAAGGGGQEEEEG